MPYARWLAVSRIRGDLDLLERWRKSIQATRPADKTELKHTLTALLALRTQENSPPVVQPNQGWSPYLAMQFMIGMSVETGYYDQSFEDEWAAQSSFCELGDGVGIKNNIAYYVTGTEQVVTSVKIKLNVNDPTAASSADDLFVIQAMHLLEQAVSLDAAERFKLQIASLEQFEAEIPYGSVNLRRDEFSVTKGGYDRVFEIVRGK